MRHLQLFKAFTTACTCSLRFALGDYAVSKVCGWNNSPHCSNRNILPQPHLGYIFNRCRFRYITREKCKAKIKKNKQTLCLGVCVSLHREGYFYLTCKSLRAEIHRGLRRSRREQQSIFRLRLTPCNPLCAETAEAALLSPSASRSICKLGFYFFF